jgi:hypothetical protein
VLFAATYNNKIQAVMYLFGTDPSRQELKLKAVRSSDDLKKIVEALIQLPGMEVATIQIPHLKGEEIFEEQSGS